MALGETHLSHLQVLFLEETFCFFPCFIFPFFVLPTSRCCPWQPSFAGMLVGVFPLHLLLFPTGSAPSQPQQHLPRCSRGQPCSWHDAEDALHPPRTGQATRTCCAGFRIRPSPVAMGRKHPRACYRAHPCSVLKPGHGKDKEKHKPAQC